jgi:triosephosphate isomerase
MARRKLVAGNWKMHGVAADLAEVNAISLAAETAQADVALCVPATLIERAVRAAPGFAVGGQDVHQADKGAHTGCISAAMLLDAGAKLTIVGHSERREAQGESDADVKAKAESALAAGLGVILCVGESDAVREAGQAVAIVSSQLDASLPHDPRAAPGIPARLAVAYEPIWAIGSGKVPSTADIGEMHAALRARLKAAYGGAGEEIRILYGGSVKASNAAEIFGVADVDGALVGGASLKAADFLPIVEAASA